MSKPPFSSEKDFIQAIRQRNPEAASYLYDTYGATLYKIVRLHIADPEKAETVFSLTMLHIWDHIGDHETQDSRLLIWMAGIARKASKEATAITTVYTLRDSGEPGEDPLFALVEPQ